MRAEKLGAARAAGEAGAGGAEAGDGDADRHDDSDSDAAGGGAALAVKQLHRKSRRAAAATAQGKAPLPAGNIGDVSTGRGRERRQAVSSVELLLPRLVATYQDIATQRGEAAAKQSGLAKIRTLLAAGIAAAD
jgi:hypothetical protein